MPAEGKVIVLDAMFLVHTELVGKAITDPRLDSAFVCNA